METKEKFLAIYYERVSTKHIEQNESLENQRALAENFLFRHKEIILAEPLDTYSERESGKSDSRPKYRELMHRLECGDISYLLVKDFKRLNRSVELSVQLREHARTHGYKIILLSTSQVYDPNTDENRLFYGFESLVNEEVVHRQSAYARLAHQQKCLSRKLNQNNITFGYCWDANKKDIIICQEEAEIIRQIFDKYVFCDLGISEIRKYLATIGINVCANTVTNWLKESAYVGTFHFNKRGSVLGIGAGKKTKRHSKAKEEWISVARPDLAIVDERIFILAQRIRESRQRHFEPDKNGIKQARFKGSHVFSTKLFCAECSYPMVHGYADRKQQIGIYRDSFKMRSRDPLQSCPNIDFKRLYEEDLKEIVVESVNDIISEHRDCFPLLIKTLEKVIREDDTNRVEITDKQKRITKLRKESDKVLDKFTYASGALLAELDRKYNALIQEIERLEEEIQQLENVVVEEKAVEERLKAIEEEICGWNPIDKDSLDRATVEQFISKMTIDRHGHLDIILNTNRVISFDMQTKKKEDRFGLPSSVKGQYDVETYSKQLRALIQRLHKERKYHTNIELRSFVHEASSYKENRVMRVGIMVEIHS